MLEIHFECNEYNDLLDAKRSKVDVRYDPTNLILDEYDYDELYKEESDNLTASDDEEEPHDLLPQEEYEEVKEGKRWLQTNY